MELIRTDTFDINKYRNAKVSTPQNNKSKTSKNPFKKGSWKYTFYKFLIHFKSNKFIESFHCTKITNFVIYKNESPKVISFKKPLTEKNLDKLNKKYKDCYILINSSDGIYSKISLKSYEKLMHVDKIRIRFKLSGSYDCDEELFDIYDKCGTIDSITELMNFINYHRQSINGIYEIQSYCCCFTDYYFKFKILVVMDDKTTKTYNGDMNDFMKDFDLLQF